MAADTQTANQQLEHAVIVLYKISSWMIIKYEMFTGYIDPVNIVVYIRMQAFWVELTNASA